MQDGMNDSTHEYNLAAIRQLLLAAFTAEELRRFLQDRPMFRPIVARFGPGHGFEDMVDRVIDYCETRLIWPKFLTEARQVNPNQFSTFEPSLMVSEESSVPSHMHLTNKGLHTSEPEVSDAQVTFSPKLLGIDDDLDEHLYQLEVTVENLGRQLIHHHKLEFTFPDLDAIPLCWKVAGSMDRAHTQPASDASRAIVEISPSADTVSHRRSGYTLQVTYRSAKELFPSEVWDLTPIIGLTYRINRNIFANIRAIPPLVWRLYADNAPRKEGVVAISDLNRY
jgi:hypothetical protein